MIAAMPILAATRIALSIDRASFLESLKAGVPLAVLSFRPGAQFPGRG